MSDLVPVKAGLPSVGRALASRILVPATIADAGENAAQRFLEFFAATIRNRNTRITYRRAVRHFLA